MDREKIAIIAYVAVSLVAVTILVILLSRKKKSCQHYSGCSKEGFRKCICSEGQGGREQDCQDTVVVNNLYVTNKLTEFSKLPDKGWSTVSPGDVDFPKPQGCNWTGSPGKDWVKWDFTDFGS